MHAEYTKSFFAKYIEKTRYKAIVQDRRLFLAQLDKTITDLFGIDYGNGGVCLTSRSLKHLFDKKPAEEFLFVMGNLYSILKYPTKVYKNKDNRRGQYCVVAKIDGDEYFCALEVDEKSDKEVYIPTTFRLRDDKYLNNYTLLWDWGNGGPHRHTLNP